MDQDPNNAQQDISAIQGTNNMHTTNTSATSTFDEKQYAMLLHLSALSMFVTGFGYILGPLILWLVKKDQSEFVDRNGKEAVNFAISVTIYYIVSAILVFVLVGILMLIVLGILHLVFIIVAGIKAKDGEDYKYPLTIRFIS